MAARREEPATGLQKEFRRLTRRIATLQQRIVKERERLERLLARFLVEIGPIESQLAPRWLALAKAVAAAHARWPLDKPGRHEVRVLILHLVTNVLAVEGRNAEAAALRDEWSGLPRTDDPDRNAATKKKLREGFRREFGFDADVLDDGDDSADGFERFRERLGEEVRRADEEQARRASEARATKRDLRKRQRLAEQESVRLRSVRSVYLNLAKVLHPDANSLYDERARREHDMKRAIEAYRQQDLVTLLELEQEWGTHDGPGLDRLGDEVLEVYIATLRRRVKQLDYELRIQMHDGRFSRIAPVADLTGPKALREIQCRADDLREEIGRTDRLVADLARCRGKRAFASLVSSYLDDNERRTDREIERLFDDES